jgi:hypothetical protein
MDIDFDCQPHTSNKAISSIYSELLASDEQLNRRPAYQRSPVWDEEQKSNLIDSIVKRCPMPVFLLYSYEKDIPECIDGQNRLTTIKEYIEQTPSEACVPWAWIKEYEDHLEFVFYTNSITQEAMTKYCESKTKMTKGLKKNKIYRLMTPTEVKRFNGYQCTISEIQTKLTFDQRKDIFLRWQSGTGISQCDRYKNEDAPFCNFVIEQELEKILAPRISACLKTGRKNWLWDLYRLIHVFYEGNTEPESVFISTIKSRTRIKAVSEEAFSSEEMKNAVKRCEKFLGRFPFLSKVKGMYISFLLQIAFIWNLSPVHIREVMEREEFLLKFAETNLCDETMNHNTLNNGPNETAVVSTYPRFRMAFMVAYDEQKPEEAVGVKKKNKETIPAARKTEVWNKYIGEEIGKAKCVCCGLRDITSRDFATGHVISEEDGGTIDATNLRPICAICNSSMGSKNMVAWMKRIYPTNKLVGI